MSRNQTFSIQIPIDDKEKMNTFQEVMNQLSKAMINEETRIAKELNCSEWAACDILYLRSRSRWSQELENEILRLDSLGKHPPVLAGWKGQPEEEWDAI